MIRRMYSDTGTTGAGAWRDASLCLLVGRLWGHEEFHNTPSTTYIDVEFDGELKNDI